MSEDGFTEVPPQLRRGFARLSEQGGTWRDEELPSLYGLPPEVRQPWSRQELYWLYKTMSRFWDKRKRGAMHRAI